MIDSRRGGRGRAGGSVRRAGPVIAAAAVAGALGLAACGGAGGSGGPGRGAGGTETSGATARPLSSAHTGRAIFTAAGCAGCHTLAAAHSHGAVGPNLDQLKPSVAVVRHQVAHGGGGMPAFAGQLTRTQIAAVATFVAGASRRG